MTKNGIKYFPRILILFTLCLMALGGIVHGTGSSLACPDWPTCYGSLMPKMEGNIAIEHGHRMLATFVGMLTIVLMVMLFKQSDQYLKKLGVAALVLVIVQGLLGGLTVIYQLPDLVSTAHLGTSMIFLATLTVIAWRGSGMEVRPIHMTSFQRWAVIGATGIVYFQILLGAFVRHTGSGIVCTEFPTCFGSLWPTGIDPAVTTHMLHRWMGIIAFLSIGSMPFVLKSLWVQDSRFRWLSLLAAIMAVVQVDLGITSVMTALDLVWVTLHLLVAAILLMAMVSLNVLIKQRL